LPYTSDVLAAGEETEMRILLSITMR